MSDLEAKLRADAQANRDRLLEVAREALTADPAASLNSVAKTAGVGAGTLYRHFPTREALVVAVYRREIDELVRLAAKLLAENPPLRALLKWCDRLAKAGRTKQGINVVLQAAITDEDHKATYEPIMKATGLLMDACREAGDIGADIDAQSFLILVSFLWKMPPGAASEARAKRLLAFVFHGMGANKEVVREFFPVSARV
ncbi:TetR/AcrR family transcriptional regulator [Bradyrhizobium prioriisuperbiae]|uniref:TetR/AcrR family transcriptional regulator n=1 Tax=Bradyrhizobium prioriisuperbiae TaxID=2854389 RepID=UPI0028ED0E62|nr:TetR/AcrR family transcriptional regulator [Bradyrhizobium prioritasuperba]